MIKTPKIKVYLLLLLMAVSIFPFRLLCHEEVSEVSNHLILKVDDSHHDCPFCTFQFCNEYINLGSIHFRLDEIAIEKNAKPNIQHTLSRYVKLTNKGPPTFM